jgi:hypothetical protein
MGARSGTTAALLVHFIDDVLSGRDIFIMAYAPQADPAGFIDKLGERYEVTRTNIKKWTVGSPNPCSDRRAGKPAEAVSLRAGAGKAGSRQARRRQGQHRGQRRHARCLPPVHDRGDAE